MKGRPARVLGGQGSPLQGAQTFQPRLKLYLHVHAVYSGMYSGQKYTIIRSFAVECKALSIVRTMGPYYSGTSASIKEEVMSVVF